VSLRVEKPNKVFIASTLVRSQADDGSIQNLEPLLVELAKFALSPQSQSDLTQIDIV
jgi:hypothetical protein